MTLTLNLTLALALALTLTLTTLGQLMERAEAVEVVDLMRGDTGEI